MTHYKLYNDDDDDDSIRPQNN